MSEGAGTLMTLLPSGRLGGCRDRSRISNTCRAELRLEMRGLHAELRSDLHELRAEFYKEQRQQVITFLALNAVLVSVIVTVIQLLTQ